MVCVRYGKIIHHSEIYGLVSHFLYEFICLCKKLAHDVNVPINNNRGDR